MAEHDPEKLKAFWQYMETWKGLATALIVCNGTGLGYCLTILNSDTPKYNVGAFVAIFGAGVLLGGLYFLILTILKAEVTSAIVTQQRPGVTIRGKIIEWSGLISMWGSAAAFCLGILLFIYRFVSF
jgi:hypothetical protein